MNDDECVMKKSHDKSLGKVVTAQPLVFAFSLALIYSIITYLLTHLSLRDSKAFTGTCTVDTKMENDTYFLTIFDLISS